jgi:hypothetical protein
MPYGSRQVTLKPWSACDRYRVNLVTANTTGTSARLYWYTHSAIAVYDNGFRIRIRQFIGRLLFGSQLGFAGRIWLLWFEHE